MVYLNGLLRQTVAVWLVSPRPQSCRDGNQGLTLNVVPGQFWKKLPDNSSEVATATPQRIPDLCQGSYEVRLQLQEIDHLLRVSGPILNDQLHLGIDIWKIHTYMQQGRSTVHNLTSPGEKKIARGKKNKRLYAKSGENNCNKCAWTALSSLEAREVQ